MDYENTQRWGVISDTGASALGTQPPGSAPVTVFYLPVTAISAGTEIFTPSFAGTGQYAFLDWGDDNALSAAQLTFIPATVQITGGQSSLAVSGAGQAIADGSTTPDTDNATDVGAAAYGGQPITRTYTITNSGTGALTLGNVSLGGDDPGDFAVIGQPAASVAPGAAARP